MSRLSNAIGRQGVLFRHCSLGPKVLGLGRSLPARQETKKEERTWFEPHQAKQFNRFKKQKLDKIIICRAAAFLLKIRVKTAKILRLYEGLYSFDVGL